MTQLSRSSGSLWHALRCLRKLTRVVSVMWLGLLIGGCTAIQGSNSLPPPRSLPLNEATIELHGMTFSPREVVVPAGEPLMITLVNNDAVAHDFVMNGDNRSVHIFVSAGRSIATSLFFDVPGVYPFVCSQSGHEAAGMVGQIRVE